MSNLITIDRDKIMAKIRWHEQESKELHALLDRLDSAREFAADGLFNGNGNGNGNGNVSGPGRPVKVNPVIDVMRKFVESQTGDFDHKQLKAAVGPARKDRIRAAVKALDADGILHIVHKPNGRNQGLYRRKVVKSE